MWTNVTGSESQPLLLIEYTIGVDAHTITRTVATNYLGQKSDTLYGVFGQPTQQTEKPAPGSGYGDQVTKWALNTANGNVNTVTENATGSPALMTSFPAYLEDRPAFVTDPLQRTWGLTYDAPNGLLQKITSPQNLTAPAGTADRNPSEQTTVFNQDGLPGYTLDPMGRLTTFAYARSALSPVGSDWLQVTVTLPSLATRKVHLDANGDARVMEDEAGVQTWARYSADGEPVEVIEANSWVEKRITYFLRNGNGDLHQLISPKGPKTHFEYTAYNEYGVPTGGYTGQVTKILHPDGAVELFGYDHGRVSWWSRPYQVGLATQYLIVRYEYDELSRVKKIIYPASPQGIAGFTVEYARDGFGRISSVTDASGGTTSYLWDGLNRVTSVTPSGGRRGTTFGYVPDFTNKRWLTLTSVSGVGTWQEWEDTKGRLSTLQNPDGQSFRYEYNLAGQPTSLVRSLSPGVNKATTFEYFANGRLQRIRHKRDQTNSVREHAYGYDVVGRVTSETATDLSRTFGYDKLGRLTSETLTQGLATQTLGYQYDKNDNRTRVTRNGVSEYYGVDLADKLLWTNTAGNVAPNPASPPGTAFSLFSYDAFGQMIGRDRRDASGQRTITNLIWDSDGRLREATQQGLTGSANKVYAADYDADGGRYKVANPKVGGSLTNTGGLFEEGYLNATTPATTKYTPGLAERTTGLPDRVYLADQLGSARGITDAGSYASTGITGTAAFDAYGNKVSAAGAGTRFGFAGAWGYDTTDIGLQYLDQRYYDPAIGRFISRDPIGWEGGLNLYGYCDNDPVNFVDPFGLKRINPWWDWGIPLPMWIAEGSRDTLMDLDACRIAYACGVNPMAETHTDFRKGLPSALRTRPVDGIPAPSGAASRCRHPR